MRPKSFSSDFYNADRQYKAWWGNTSLENLKRQRDALKSRLRFDFLFSSSISLSRADVLDGACFQHTQPKEIRDWLAIKENDPLPITIMTSTGKLEDDLLEWVKPRGAKKLRAEPFWVIPPKLHEAYYTEFPKLPLEEVTSWKSLAKAIAKAVDSDDLEVQLHNHWKGWIEGVSYLNLRRFVGQPPYQKYLPEFLDPDIFDFAVETAEETKEASELYTSAFRTFSSSEWKRGILSRWLEEELPKDRPNVAQIVRDCINVGICRARADADNTNHETILGARLSKRALYEVPLKLLADDPAVPNRVPPIDVAIPDHLAQWLVDCNYEMLLKYIRLARISWLENSNPDSLKRLAEAIADFMGKNDPTPLPTSSHRAVMMVRIAAIVSASGWHVAKWIVHPGLGWFDGLTLLTSTGLVVKDVSKQYLDKFVHSLAKKQVVHQVVQTVRNRGIE